MIAEEIITEQISKGTLSEEKLKEILDNYGDITNIDEEKITILTDTTINNVEYRRSYELEIEKMLDLLITGDVAPPTTLPPDGNPSGPGSSENSSIVTTKGVNDFVKRYPVFSPSTTAVNTVFLSDPGTVRNFNWLRDDTATCLLPFDTTNVNHATIAITRQYYSNMNFSYSIYASRQKFGTDILLYEQQIIGSWNAAPASTSYVHLDMTSYVGNWYFTATCQR